MLQVSALILTAVTLASWLWGSVCFFNRFDSRVSRRRMAYNLISAAGFLCTTSSIVMTAPRLWQFSLFLMLYLPSLAVYWTTLYSFRSSQTTLKFAFSSPEQLIQKGIYRHIRHPFYTSYILMWLSFSLLTLDFSVIISAAVLTAFYTLAALHEEKMLLSDFEQYRDYMQKTGRFLPGL